LVKTDPNIGEKRNNDDDKEGNNAGGLRITHNLYEGGGFLFHTFVLAFPEAVPQVRALPFGFNLTAAQSYFVTAAL